MATASETDPLRYYNDRPRLDRVIANYERQGLTEAAAIRNLQRRGFKIPPGYLPESSDPLAGVSTYLRLTAESGVNPIRETGTSVTVESPGGGEVMMPLALKDDSAALALAAQPAADPQISVTKEIPREAHLAQDPKIRESLLSGEPIKDALGSPATLQLKNPLGDPEFVADIKGSFTKSPGPAELEGREAEDPTVVATPAVDEEAPIPAVEAGVRLTPEEVETLSPQVKAVVDAYMEESGSEFFQDTAELPFKADIDAVDLEIKGINDRLEQIGEEKIKPYFGKEDTGRKILAAIAAGVGAYASAMSGTPNYALQILNKAIDDDLDKQKLEIGFRRKNLEDQRVLLTTKRLELLKMTEMQLNKAWRQAQDTRAQQKIKIMLTEVLLSKDTEEQKLSSALAEALLKRYTKQQEGLVPNMGVSGGEDGVSRLTGHARKMAIESAMEFNVIYGEAQRTVAQLLDITREDKLKAMSTEALSKTRTEFVTGITALKLLAAKKIYKFGAALTTNEEKMLDEIIADAGRTNIALNVTAARLHNFMAILERKRESIRDGGGFISVGQGGGAKASTRTPLPALPTLEPGTAKK